MSARISVERGDAIVAFFFVAEHFHVVGLDPAFPVIPVASGEPSFGFPALEIIILARVVEVVFETLSVVTLGIIETFEPAVVVVVLAFLWIPDGHFPTLLVVICAVGEVVVFAPACCVLVAAAIERVDQEAELGNAKLLGA